MSIILLMDLCLDYYFVFETWREILLFMYRGQLHVAEIFYMMILSAASL